MRPLLTCASLALVALGPNTAVAEGPSALRQTAISAALFAQGMAQEDPVLILSAARLRKSLDLQPVAAPETATDDPLGWEPMIAAALALAEPEGDIAALATDIAAETVKGVITGPVYHINPLAAGAKANHPALTFRGGDYAEAYVEAGLASDINLVVLDESGKLVCADTSPWNIAYCGWTPAQDGSFTIVVENRGSLETSYALITN